jgi:hypothetical protein
MNPQTILCDGLTFIENNGLDARGFFYKVIITKTLGLYWDTLRLKADYNSNSKGEAHRK